MNPILTDFRSLLALVTSILLGFNSGEAEELRDNLPKQMKNLSELVRTKPRPPEKGSEPSNDERVRINSPHLDHIEASAGLVMSKSLPRIIISLKNPGDTEAHISFNHNSLSLRVNGYDGVRIKIPSECPDCGPRSNNDHDPLFQLWRTPSLKSGTASEPLDTVKLLPKSEVLLSVVVRADIASMIVDKINESNRVGRHPQKRPTFSFSLTLSWEQDPTEFRILNSGDLDFPNNASK